ncbi:hypothetical protein [Nonomuraea cavernae]|uniref:hypothetical protein n=1 Tax=Nonomuraea cavernae TaxID=2045107 RepID=UPI0033CA8CC4
MTAEALRGTHVRHLPPVDPGLKAHCFEGRRTQDLEWMIAPYVAAVAPRVLWRIEEGGWDLIGFEAVDGRHAVYEPGSPDLHKLTDSLSSVRGYASQVTGRLLTP